MFEQEKNGGGRKNTSREALNAINVKKEKILFDFEKKFDDFGFLFYLCRRGFGPYSFILTVFNKVTLCYTTF